MYKKTIAASTALVLIGTSLALAAPQTETGVISKIDTTAHMITLASGAQTQFWFGQGVNPSLLKVGEKVTITYDLQNGKAMASAVVAAL